MDTAHNKLISNYLNLLKGLSVNEKLEIITELSQSMKTKPKGEIPEKTWASLFGAFELDVPAEEFLSELKKDRNFHEKSMKL